MTWVAVAIAVFIIGYTVITLQFRKPNPSYQPYHDLKARGETHNLLSAGFRRIVIPAEQPVAPGAVGAGAEIQALPGGLPAALQDLLFDPPQLPAAYRDIRAPAAVPTLMPCLIQFDCAQGDPHRQPGGAALYVRDDTVLIVPEYDPLDGELHTRRDPALVQLTIPAGTLAPGRYAVTLIGAEASAAWTLQVH